jgi:purine nucleoside phosphorylase
LRRYASVVLCNELRMPVSMVCFCDNYANGINTEMDAYNEFYSNVKSNMENVEDTVACVIDVLLAKLKAEEAAAAAGVAVEAEAPAR